MRLWNHVQVHWVPLVPPTPSGNFQRQRGKKACLTGLTDIFLSGAYAAQMASVDYDGAKSGEYAWILMEVFSEQASEVWNKFSQQEFLHHVCKIKDESAVLNCTDGERTTGTHPVISTAQLDGPDSLTQRLPGKGKQSGQKTVPAVG